MATKPPKNSPKNGPKIRFLTPGGQFLVNDESFWKLYFKTSADRQLNKITKTSSLPARLGAIQRNKIFQVFEKCHFGQFLARNIVTSSHIAQTPDIGTFQKSSFSIL